MFVSAVYISDLYTFLPTVCNVETDKVCVCQHVFVHEPVMKGRGFVVERKREILVQLNLINSEMEIISTWSTGEMRDGMRESNRQGKSERTRRERRDIRRKSIFLSFSLIKSVNPHSLAKISIRAFLFAAFFPPINISSGWYDQNLLSWCEALYLKVNIRI